MTRGGDTMIQSLYRTSAGDLQHELSPEAFTTALQDPGGLLWADFSDEPPKSCEPILRGVFDFHPLAVDNALEETHVPRVDDWGRYLYVNLHAVTFNQAAQEPVGSLELDRFLGQNYLVTYHTRPTGPTARGQRELARSGQ
jgi:magnesium transporter